MKSTICSRCGRLFACGPDGRPIEHTRSAHGRDGKHRETPCERTAVTVAAPGVPKLRKR